MQPTDSQYFPTAANLKVSLCPSVAMEDGLVPSQCSKSLKCGVPLPLITEFNSKQEVHLNTWPHSSRDGASEWSNAQMWPQKSIFILRDQAILTFSTCRQVKEYRTGQSFGCWHVIDRKRWYPLCWPWISLPKLHPCREHPFRLYLLLIFSGHQGVLLTSECMKHQDMQK